MAEYIDRAAAVKVILRERKPTNSVAQNRMLSIIQRDLLTMRAAYEDTGLTPEEVTALQKDWSDLCTVIGECGGIDRLRELADVYFDE